MLGLLSRLETALSERYKDLREIGRGGTATVYHAVDRKHERPVAIKVLHPELTTALGSQRFLREIRIAAGLTHPHILALHDSGEADGLLYYVMPYVEGETLRELLVREKQLSVEEAIRITSEVGSALDHAHEHGVVHRDIKPENILLPARKACVADFGLARAIERAASDRLTGTGVAMGTPAYISPEQATGDRDVDGRSDLYSLGCVLFEMLAGVPPFRGPTVQSIVARHLGDPPPRVRAFRPAVPEPVEVALMKAMAKKPDERFKTAGQFIAALSTAGKPARPRWRWWPFAAVAVVVASAAYGASRILGANRLDPTLFAVLPFEHRSGAAPMLLDGEQCERLLYDSFTRWQDVRLVDPMRINDEHARRGGKPMSVSDAVKMARKLGAGMLARGEVWEFGDSVHVRGVIYDVARGGDRVREHSVGIARDLRGVGAKFIELATALMVGRARTPGAAADALGAHSVAAWLAYDRGRAALNEWDLPVAERELRAAITLDPEYPHAHLWLSQVIGWSGEPAKDWRTIANRTVVLADGLAPRGRRLAEASLALADARFTDACTIYHDLVKRDSTDFAAWYGLGDCQARDERVLPDAGSPSKWRYRSSYQAAMSAYSRALGSLPSMHQAFNGLGFERLSRLLYTQADRLRRGAAVIRDTARTFAAYPSWDDSLAFVPYPLQDFESLRPWTLPRTTRAALTKNRLVLLEIATTWARAFPAGAEANETLSLALEMAETSTTARAGEATPLTAIRKARTLASDPEHQLRLAASEMRLLLKQSDFGSARALADSLLAAWPRPSPGAAVRLASIAAVTGRARLTADLLSQSAATDTLTWQGRQVRAPFAVAARARALLGYASLGAPVDTIVALMSAVDQLARSYVEPEERSSVRNALLRRPLSLAFPELGDRIPRSIAVTGDYLLEMQSAVAKGDFRTARGRYKTLSEARRHFRPGDISMDQTYQEARLLLALGDTSQAVAVLDPPLSALPTLSPQLLMDVPQAAALVRAMALRAELANRAGDRETARRWSRATVTLWSSADAALQPLVDRMRALGS